MPLHLKYAVVKQRRQIPRLTAIKKCKKEKKGNNTTQKRQQKNMKKRILKTNEKQNKPRKLSQNNSIQ